MPEPIIEGDLKTPVVPPATPATPPATEAKAPSQPKKPTKSERLEVTINRLKKEKAEEDARNGVIPEVPDADDDIPLTRGDLKRLKQEEAKQTALSMAESIDDEQTREQVKDVLESRIVPSGNAQKDYEFALDAVNSEKNRQLAAMKKAGKTVAPRVSSGSGAPAPVGDEPFEMTPEEQAMIRVSKVKDPKKAKEMIMKARDEIARSEASK
jgi:hypothetical protein